ncbi:unnamed protein product [Diatraea saccharalis]|uniref:Gamma-interferon-inducible lysosomal thiol reductase n=1 Tax=Diatraea saccharalis TaxID=40085 RepID=A0A9N9R1L8_9NEOP|nr:unnamed protein product [Diatraea saccharalis]
MAVLKKFLFVFMIMVVNKFTIGYVPKQLLLSVYYESKCPDSKKFILNQLMPAMRLLPNNIILQLVPFGKAKSIDQGYRGFECQHGPSECLGNMIQSCALKLMQGKTDLQKTKYVACEMETYAAADGNLSCVQQANVDPDLVNQCIETGQGTELQLDAEFLTGLISPKFIPTVTIDGIFNQQIQDHAQIDLIGTLCSILKETKKCAQHYNSMALRYVLV